MAVEMPQPPSSDVFTMSDGEKVRLEYERVYMYKSSNKSGTTVVDIGWHPNIETLMIDMSFEDFDAKYQANRKAWTDYYNNRGSSIHY